MLLQGLLFVVYNYHKCESRSPLSCAMEPPTPWAYYRSLPDCFAFWIHIKTIHYHGIQFMFVFVCPAGFVKL